MIKRRTMSIGYVKDLIKGGHIRSQIDLPSTINTIYAKLEYDSTTLKGIEIKDTIFRLRNFCGPYNGDSLNDIIMMLNFYIHVYSEGTFKNEKKASHYKHILKTIEVIFLDIGGFPDGKNIWDRVWYYDFDRCINHFKRLYENPESYRLDECYTKPCILNNLPGFGKSTIANIIYTFNKHKILTDIK